MQTFLPVPDFEASARSLDRSRLGKQRVEAWQILGALTEPGKGWSNHPATKMWRGYEAALCLYGIAVCEEWISRGYRDTMLERFRSAYERLWSPDSEYPPWLGYEAFHASHRGNLVRKDPSFYGPFWPDADPEAEYVWPGEEEK